ncbi:MAG: CBS domain-containing protein [Actinomycetota bacterium]|nr:CBS domain-containing protein [Actinomycetota bacterium]
MPRNSLVREVMTTDVLTFRPTDTVDAAARALAERKLGGAPVVDEDGKVLGLLEDEDLIVQDSRLHVPTVISIFGGYIELPSSLRHFESDLRKAVGATVGDVMDRDAPTCREDDTLESVATVLHEQNASRMPVVDDEGRLVGIVSRGDLVRAIVGGGGE